MKKSEPWIEVVCVKCPHCGWSDYYHNIGDEGDLVRCITCAEQFQLGEQR